jgi:hypothetical protein
MRVWWDWKGADSFHSAQLVTYSAMKTYGRLTSALGGGKCSASRCCCFIPAEKAPGTNMIGGWVGPRASLDAVQKRKILHCWESNLGHKAPQPSVILTVMSKKYGDDWSNCIVTRMARALLGNGLANTLWPNTHMATIEVSPFLCNNL